MGHVYFVITREPLSCEKIMTHLYRSESFLSGKDLLFKTKKVKKVKTRRFPEGFIILSYDIEDKRFFKKIQRKIFRSLAVRALPSIYLFPYAVQEHFPSVDEIREFLQESGRVYRSPVVVPMQPLSLKERIYEYHRALGQMTILRARKYEQEEKFSKRMSLELKTDVKILKERSLWYTQRGIDLTRVYDKAYKAVLRYRHLTEEKHELIGYFNF